MRGISFVCLLLLSTLLPVPLLAVLAFLYSLKWSAYELLILAALLDSFYGVGHVVPYYTTVLFASLLIIEWAKPQFLIYNR